MMFVVWVNDLGLEPVSWLPVLWISPGAETSVLGALPVCIA